MTDQLNQDETSVADDIAKHMGKDVKKEEEHKEEEHKEEKEEKGTEEEEEEEEEKEEEEKEVLEPTAKEKELLAQIEDLRKRLEETSKREEAPLTGGEFPEEKKPPIDEVYGFITTKEMEAFDDPEISQDDKAKILNAAISKAVHKAVEHTWRMAPVTAKRLARETMSTGLMVERFFQDNPPLQSHRAFCGNILTEIASKAPEMPTEELFAKTAEEAYKRLHLTKEAEKKAPSKVPIRTPGGSPPRKPVAPKLTGVTADIIEHNKKLAKTY